MKLPRFAQNKSSSDLPSSGRVTVKPKILTSPIPPVKLPTSVTTFSPPVMKTEPISRPSIRTAPVVRSAATSPYPQTRTPVMPKIGLRYSSTPKFDYLSEELSEDEVDIPLGEHENPWIPSNIDGPTDVKIISMTPVGTIAAVPTTTSRPVTPSRVRPPTPGRSLVLKVIDPSTGDPIKDPLLDATIYLDCTKPNDRDYHFVHDRMRSISQSIRELQNQYKNVFKPLLSIRGKVTKKQFETALSIYENNQVYYQDQIDSKSVDMTIIQTGLTELEHWFMCIIEPRTPEDLEGWKAREKNKITKGVSSYCDPELYPYIRSLSVDQRNFIMQQHQKMGL